MSDEDPHKRMRRFGELCGYFYGRRFFGLETIMSDRDSDHMLLELQEARAEIDRLRELLRWRDADKEKPNESGWYTVTFKGLPVPDYYHIEEGWCGPLRFWRPIGEMPVVQNILFSKESVAMYECKCGFMKNSNEACLNCGPLPGVGGEQ